MLDPKELNQLKEFRRQLHQNPELSGQEVNTAKLVSSFLKKYAPDQLLENIGGNSLVAIWKGVQTGNNILFRAELDALPIHETNSLPYASIHDGISHKCGHDGHMSILCGIAMLLSKEKLLKGDVLLLFQHAEETGQGAKAILSDERFQALDFDYAFALHNLPKRKKGTVFIKKGSFCAASTGLKIKLIGKTAHASQPETGNNPALAAAQLTFCFNKILDTVEFTNKTLITLTHMAVGNESFGVSAGHAEIWVTLRAFEKYDFDLLLLLLQKEARDIASKNNLEIDFSFHESFEATENDVASVEVIKSAAEANNIPVKTMRKPNPWSEDFGLFLKNTQGAMFGLGAGKKTPDLHNSNYDFPDEIIEPGVKMFWGIIQQLNS